MRRTLGLRILLILPAFAGPLLLTAAVNAAPPTTTPTVIDESVLLPAGLVVALICAVWKASSMFERTTVKLEVLEEKLAKMEERLDKGEEG